MTVPISALLALEDPTGFLTITASFAPSTFDDRGASAPPRVRGALREIVRDLDDELGRAVKERIEESQGAIDDVLDPYGSGRGRLLVIGVGSGEVRDVRLQAPLPTEVRFEDGPALRRVLEVVDEHPPTAGLLLHRSEAVLLRLELGAYEPVESWATELGDRVFAAEFYGPGSPNTAQRGNTNREAREDRVQANLDRFLTDVADDVRGQLDASTIDRIVLVGQTHERETVAERLAGVSGLEVLHVDRVADGPSQDVMAAIAEAQVDAHRAEELRLATEAVDRALAGGAGTIGVDDTITALNEGRVHHLLLTPFADAEGYRGDDGMLGVVEDDPRLHDAVPEPRLIHRMIERALATDARVTPVDREAAAHLGEHGEVAALLRW